MTTITTFLQNMVELAETNHLFVKRQKREYCESFEQIMNFLTCSGEPPRDVNLRTRGPRKIFFPISDEHVIMDFTGVAPLLKALLLPIARKSGETGNKKSRHFEIKTNSFIITTVRLT